MSECLENALNQNKELKQQEEEQEQELHLYLRKWANLHPSMEFRCFISQRNLVGTISCILFSLKCFLTFF